METKKGKNMLRDIIVTVKIRFVMGPCLNGQSKERKQLTARDSICYTASMAQETKERKERVQGQCTACNRSTALQEQSRSAVLARRPTMINACKCCTHSTCTAVQFKTSSNGKHVIGKHNL